MYNLNVWHYPCRLEVKKFDTIAEAELEKDYIFFAFPIGTHGKERDWDSTIITDENGQVVSPNDWKTHIKNCAEEGNWAYILEANRLGIEFDQGRALTRRK